MLFICSRWVCCDNQIRGNVVYLFAVSLPRQANRRKCRLSIRGGLAVTSNSPEMSFIYSRCARRGKQIAGNVVYLFAVSSSRHDNLWKNRFYFIGLCVIQF